MVNVEGLFFEYRYFEKTGECFTLSKESRIAHTDIDGYACRHHEKTLAACEDGTPMQISLFLGIPEEKKARIKGAYADNAEGYLLEVCEEEGRIGLYAKSHRGLIYAAATLRSIVEAGKLSSLILFDYPDKEVRGYRVYTPGRAYIPKFKEMIEMLVAYKYNALMIEVGGAMEYKRHPEINAAWVEFCKEVSVSPEYAQNVQNNMYYWMKDSIHFDNGNGAYITQDEMRDLIAYCREREIEVYPEVPTMSHSDYIVRAHRDLNERAEDNYPDTYCPSNPKTYEIVFDILDEVADVFGSEYINIGHDEFYTAAKCPLCKDRSPSELYVGDIVKIKDYLAKKGIKPIIWADKLFKNIIIHYDENDPLMPFGANPYPKKDIPALYEVKELLPNDVTLLNWSWKYETIKDEEKELVEEKKFSMLYGNFCAHALKDYRERIARTRGGFVSNWGSVEEKYMQRNLQNFNLVSTAWIFWNADYDTPMCAKVIEKTKTLLYNCYKASLGEGVIEITHATKYFEPYRPFFDGRFIVDEEFHLGNHVVTYADGSTAKLPVYYGYNIASSEVLLSAEEYAASGIAVHKEPVGASLPIYENGALRFKAAYKNPHPEKKIASVTYEKIKDVEVTTFNASALS